VGKLYFDIVDFFCMYEKSDKQKVV